MKSAISFLSNGGECGEMIKSLDWSGNPLGSPENWPTTLKTAISIVLQSHCPMMVWWGADLTIICNDAYLPLTGHEQASCIGRSAYKLWADNWQEDLLPIKIQVIDNGEVVHRKGMKYLISLPGNSNEIFFDLSYSPLADDGGNIQGLICVCLQSANRTPAFANDQTAPKNFTLDAIQLFENIADTMPGMIWITQPGGECSYLNERWYDYTGLAKQDALGLGWLACLHPDDRENSRRIYMEANDSQKYFNLVYRLKHKDGHYNWFIDSGKPRFDSEGRYEGSIGSLVNIDEQKVFEENTARLASIVQSSSDAIISKTLQGIITSWNPAAERLFGYTAKEMIGQSIDLLIPGDRKNEESDIIERIKKGEPVEHYETIRLDNKSNPIDISLTISPIKNSMGRVIGASKIARNITEQKKLADTIYESEQKFRRLVVQAPIGITIFRGANYIVEMANNAYLDIICKTQEEFVGKPLFDVLPEVKDAVGPLLAHVMSTGNTYYGNEFGVTLYRRGKKEDAYFNFIYQALWDEQQQINGVIVIANEVTDEVNAKHLLTEREREFRRMVTQSPIAMTIWRGVDHIIEIANDEMLHTIWRLEEKDVIGKKALEVFPELIDQKYPALLQEVLKNGKVHRENESVAYVQGKDGLRKFYLDFEYAPLFEADGSVSGIMITVNDVTEKAEAKHRLEDAESRLRMTAEGTGLAVWDLDLQTRDIIYSSRLMEIFGHDADTVLSHPMMRQQVHPHDLPLLEKAFEVALQTGIYDYQARVIRPDNTVCWVRTQGRVIFDKGIPQRMLGIMQDITIQKNAQNVIAESENRLSIAIEAAELGTWELNMKTDESNYSARYLRIMGFDENASPSHTEVLKRVHPDDRALRAEAITNALRTGVLDMEIRVIHEDYSVHWIKARGKVFYDEKGEAARMLGTTMDITQRETTIINLQESEERFRTIANSAPVMIWMSGNDRFSDFFNTSWLRFTGRKIEQEIGDGWLDGVHPDDMKKCITIYQSSLKEQKAFYTEYRLRHHTGQYRWISDNAVPRYGSDGKFIGFISACMDIDDQKKSVDKVMESELLFKTITNVSPVALWMTDKTGANSYVNDTWVEWTTEPDQQADGKDWMSSVLEEDRDGVSKKFLQAYNSRNNFTAEFRIKRADGIRRWVLSEGSPYYDIDGFFAGYAGSVLDITERKKDELRKNEFLAVASHELKTPLTSIKAYTQLLAGSYEKGEDQFLKNALGKIGNQVNKMTKLVGDFLNLSKIESDKFHVRTELFDIYELVKEVTAEIQLVSPSHELIVEDAREIKVSADREKVAQVITNLLNNAVKYSPENRTVTINIEAGRGYTKVAVTDKGIGIKKEEHGKIFQRFYRSEFNNNISFSGFGIGLYISAEIIRSHQGEIGVRSAEGEGATFYFTLPAGEQ